MYHIAICDDDEKFIKFMERLCRQANGGRDEELKFYEYHSGEELVWELESIPQILDMLILDMQFGKGKMDGDAAAAKFREMFPDAVLIFCSGVCLPTVRSFYATPFRYLIKTQPNDEIVRVLREALAETGRRQEEKFLVGHYRGASFRIRHKDILYVERAKRGGNIRVRPDSPAADKAEKLLTDQKLEDLAEELKDDGFAMPQNSFLVNLYHIEVLYGLIAEGHEVTLLLLLIAIQALSGVFFTAMTIMLSAFIRNRYILVALPVVLFFALDSFSGLWFDNGYTQPELTNWRVLFFSMMVNGEVAEWAAVIRTGIYTVLAVVIFSVIFIRGVRKVVENE